MTTNYDKWLSQQTPRWLFVLEEGVDNCKVLYDGKQIGGVQEVTINVSAEDPIPKATVKILPAYFTVKTDQVNVEEVAPPHVDTQLKLSVYHDLLIKTECVLHECYYNIKYGKTFLSLSEIENVLKQIQIMIETDEDGK